MATKKIEIQDSNGNVYYPHTEASVVKNGNTTVAAQLNENTQDISNLRTDKQDKIEDSGWQNGTLLNGFTGTVQYRKYGKNIEIKLSDVVSTTQVESAMFNLPVEFKPSQNLNLTTYSLAGSLAKLSIEGTSVYLLDSSGNWLTGNNKILDYFSYMGA